MKLILLFVGGIAAGMIFAPRTVQAAGDAGDRIVRALEQIANALDRKQEVVCRCVSDR